MGSQSTTRSLRLQSQQLPTESQVFEDKVVPGTDSADQPAEEMSERHDQDALRMEALVDCATQRLPIPQVQYNCRLGRQFDEIYDQPGTRRRDTSCAIAMPSTEQTSPP